MGRVQRRENQQERRARYGREMRVGGISTSLLSTDRATPAAVPRRPVGGRCARRPSPATTPPRYRRAPGRYGLGDKLLWRQYINAFYWGAATITTVGYGDVSPTSMAEIIFAIICIIMAVIIYTLIIANLEDIVANLDVTSTLNSMKREKVKQWCLRSYLPEAVQDSIFDYYDKLWAQQKGVSGSKVLGMLPENLRSHVTMELIGDTVRKLTFVSTCRPRVVDEIALAMDLDLYMPKDFLFHAGECAWQVFFVFFGAARLLDEATGQVYAKVENEAIGEAEFFLRGIYKVAGQATDYSQIFVLAHKDLVKILTRNHLLDDFKKYCVQNEGAIEDKNPAKDASAKFGMTAGEKSKKGKDAGRYPNFKMHVCYAARVLLNICATLWRRPLRASRRGESDARGRRRRGAPHRRLRELSRPARRAVGFPAQARRST